MVKTVMLDGNTHERLDDLQDILKRKYKLRMSYGEIVDSLVGGDPDKTADELVKKIIS